MFGMLIFYFFHTIDVNECASNTYECPNITNCQNTFGSYECQCRSGFTGPGGDDCTGMLRCNLEPIFECLFASILFH